MGSAAAPKHTYFWRSPMAKASLVHRFTQVLLNPNKEASKVKAVQEEQEEEESAPSPASKLTSRRHRRLRLEMDVERLHERLQQETELHSALKNAITRAAGAFSTFPRNLPVDAQELLADVAMLEVAVSSLEEQMIGLELQIQHERNERLRNAVHQTASPLLSKQKGSQQHMIEGQSHKSTNIAERPSSHERMTEGFLEPVCVDSTAQSKHSQPCASNCEITSYELEEDVSLQSCNSDRGDHPTTSTQEGSILHRCMESDAEDSENGCQRSRDECAAGVIGCNHPDGSTSDTKSLMNRIGIDNGGASCSCDSSIVQGKLDKLWKQPNRLSQEMVSCMIGIYCHLADPSEAGKQIIADNLPSPSSPFGRVTSSSFSSLSDLSSMSFARSPPYEPKAKEQSVQSNADPYRTHDKLEWGDIGSYSSAAEVAWMTVGKEQLEYAADALRLFRSLVEQLSRVDATTLRHDEKLAFWINIYNALMMHAYLAYGVPKNDVKYFALMQKAAYTVGGHFFNAMAIEHVLLRRKAPTYRPQIALLLALHKVKIPEGASKFAIGRPEPLVVFALSCGAWSSPAVRIYTPDNIQVQLQAALHDYVRASVGISHHGKLLIPKLLHCYARELNIQKETGENDEGRALVFWLSSFLPAGQATLVRDTVQQRAGCPQQQPISSLILVQPFNFRLRYLFLH
ncbi:hypothetical protein GOP47_0006441 [Adiantum capillus-veneris]|uniref:Uncharacterized protein n=1 Tax=Adiantum capillus-veneris TaxID=13818 RepID=A0A9D4V3F5_ADICA|nr:hypothetical protein GOP47_0006441 [Adiantum capillus-veneris]